MPNGKGFRTHADSKTQPPELQDRDCSYHGDSHDFNIKGKITNVKGSDYHDVARKDSGLHGNFAEKDAQLAYLKEQNKKGQVVKAFNGTSESNRIHTHNVGVTAYNNRPISEVYRPATSQEMPPSEPIVRPPIMKREDNVPVMNTKDVTKKIKR